MHNRMKYNLDDLIGGYKSDLEMVSRKNKDEEWKRDHYRYISAIAFQRIFNMLNAQVTEIPPAPVNESTRRELIILRKIIDAMVEKP